MEVGLPFKSIEERFWEKVDKKGDDECWNWKGVIDSYGYGTLGGNGTVHRISWKLHFGEIPEGLHVLHTCDNRTCVNSNHLFLGTNDDNVKDKVAKKRHYKGEDCHFSKLTQEMVREIREKYANGVKITFLAKEFNVSTEQIRVIVSNESWKDDNYKPVRIHGKAKLNWDEVHQIREKHKKGEKQVDLAKEFGVNPRTINVIVLNKVWKE